MSRFNSWWIAALVAWVLTCTTHVHALTPNATGLDPLAALPEPNIPSDPNVNFGNVLIRSGTHTLQPGLYDNLSITGGDVTLQPGLYYITGELKHNGGNIDATSGVMLFFGPTGNMDIAGNGSFRITGMSPTTYPNGPTIPVGAADVPVPIFQSRSNANLAELNITNDWLVDGSIYIPSGDVLTRGGASSPLATGLVAHSVEVRGSAPTHINSGSAWTIFDNLSLSGTMTIPDGGQVCIVGGGGVSISSNSTINLSGGMLSTIGRFDNTQSGAFNFSGGTFKAVEYLGDLNNAGGTFSPGQSPAVSSISGAYTQDSNSILQIEVGGLTPGGEYDQLHTAGPLLLAGTLDILLVNDYIPTIDDEFEILLFDSTIIGKFNNVITPPGMSLEYLSNKITISAQLVGDLNLDGFVGIGDLNIVLGNWNQSVSAGVWALGDPSGDGFVGIADLNEVLGNWNAGTPPQSQANIPEPASLFLLSGLTALVFGRKISV